MPLQSAVSDIRYVRLPLPPGRPDGGEVDLLAAWLVDGPSLLFGGISAMLWRPDGGFLLVSDGGVVTHLSRPDAPGPPTRVQVLPGIKANAALITDMESITQDPGGTAYWIGLESANAIARYAPDMTLQDFVRPPEMRGWGLNAGPESMLRLPDGRFIVLGEGSLTRQGTSPALLFPSDPLDGAAALQFRFDRPAGYSPVDMAQLPDGRVVVLLRRLHWSLPPHFTAMLMLLDPADIAEGATWRGRIIARLDDPALTDNFEALAIAPEADGRVALWVMSDDNNSGFQRTLLLKLRWDPR